MGTDQGRQERSLVSNRLTGHSEDLYMIDIRRPVSRQGLSPYKSAIYSSQLFDQILVSV